MTETPIHVVTSHDPRTNTTETAGAFTGLAEAKQCAVDTLDAIGEPHRMFLEEWHGGTFHAHRELRPDSDNPSDPAFYQWFVAQGPAFAPTEESGR